MTNAEKYLKDGVDVDDFVGEFNDFCAMQTSNQASSVRLAQFLSRTIHPTLTEDERVILRNIDTDYYPTIKKTGETLYIVSNEDFYKEIDFMFKDHLFQFIKEGEEYNIQELLGDE